RPCARFSRTTSVKASSAFSASFRLSPERAAIWWASSPLTTMCSVAICVCSSFVFMGRTKHVPCPSAVLLSVVPTKPCYTIVPVFVKGRCLLLEMFLARHVGAGLARQHLLAAGCAPPVLLPSTRVPGSLALGTRAQLPRGVGCEAKKRGAKSSLLHLAGGPLAAP